MSSFINARTNYPSIFSLSSVGSSGTFTDMAGVLTIGDIAFSKETIDVTNQGTTDGYQQFIPKGITKVSPIEITAHYLSTASQQTSIIPALMDAGTRIGWKFTMAGTSSNNIWYGDGLITGYSMGGSFDDKIGFKMSIQPNGKPLGPLSSTT